MSGRWRRDGFASMDWGFNAPGCVLWWLCLVDGHYHICREYKFQQQSVEAVAKELKRITRELDISLRTVACDPAMKQKTGAGRGEAIFETLQRYGLPMRASDHDRFNGWLRVHELLREAPDGRPWLTIEPTCRYLIRTLSAATSKKDNPDDVGDTDDHALDALRYGAMSRPSPGTLVGKSRPEPGTLGYYRRLDETTRRGVLWRSA